ncbi:MAG TPA: four helix bundle protein [Burkholderiales bacterium]|jgi:four helix bundle protein|nr:four helix bundle protein [Burkholderiales bacterium]
MKDEGRQSAERDLVGRTRRFALDVIMFYSALPITTVCQVLGRQLLRSATSVGAHYREAQRAKSGADIVSKVEAALQELDETGYWLELFKESGNADAIAVKQLQTENQELLKIFVTIAKSSKKQPRKGTK